MHRYPNIKRLAAAEDCSEFVRAGIRAALCEPAEHLRVRLQTVELGLRGVDSEFGVYQLAEWLRELEGVLQRADRELGACRPARAVRAL